MIYQHKRSRSDDLLTAQFLHQCRSRFVDLELTEELTQTSKIILNILANSVCLLYRNVTISMDFVKGS